MWPKCAFGDQKGLIRNKDMPFGNPPHQGTKIADFQKIFFCFFYRLWTIKWYFVLKNGVFECFEPGVR